MKDIEIVAVPAVRDQNGWICSVENLLENAIVRANAYNESVARNAGEGDPGGDNGVTGGDIERSSVKEDDYELGI